MEELFKKLGRKGADAFNRGRWYWKSSIGTEQDAIQAEYILGKNLAHDMISQITINSDPDINLYLDKISQKLKKRLTNKKRSFKFLIHHTEDVNAYALPGGFIFITSGLINQLENEPDELAFVLAHEMMHVVRKHAIQRIFHGYKTKMLNIILSRYTKMGAITKQVLGKFMTSNYSRENELEADYGALLLMTSAGFDSYKSVSLLRRLGTQTKEPMKIFNYFASHPPIEKRISQLAGKV